MQTLLGVSFVLIFVGLPIVLVLAIYALPSIVAWRRKKWDCKTIVLLNLLLGWVEPVWIYTCVCAFLDNPVRPQDQLQPPSSADGGASAQA